MRKINLVLAILIIFIPGISQGDFIPAENQFRQLGTKLNTPNAYRNGAGQPGYGYWQQRADYQIDITLDDRAQKISGTEIITYHNNSPDDLYYLWLQLDQNVRQKESFGSKTRSSSIRDSYPSYAIRYIENTFDGGFHITTVEDLKGNPIPYTINYTMMRIDLADPLETGDKVKFRISYWYKINDRQKDGGGRSGMEYFEDDDNYLYTIAQFYPRMAVYSDHEGWQNKQFSGRSEFALPFGDFDVKISVPEDHLMAATGVLVNPKNVLTDIQLERLDRARSNYDNPVIIASGEEALERMQYQKEEMVTWHFKANNVRDFAFASSRRFIWDAMAVKIGDQHTMAMSMYPPEGNPLWEKYSTRVVAHTLKVYSGHTFDYPYPVAWSIHTDRIGMEYPMIAFNGGRPERDGTYSERTKWGMIGVIIHEIGHNFFPMIVNSDERQWTWMDEGLNTFLQGVAERAWDHNHPDPSGRPRDIVGYMRGDKTNIAPIMVNGDLVMQFSANAYSKPSTGLNILRETIMGRELFDFAFKQYARSWMFKHPTPDDFFRIMEDASAVDLDWFWRGWFYGTDPVDIAIKGVKIFTIKSKDPEIRNSREKEEEESIPDEIAVQRNRKSFKSVVEREPEMRDFYDEYDEYAVTARDKLKYERYLDKLTDEEKAFINSGKYYVQIDFENVGGMVMPLIVKFTYDDQTTEIFRVPAEIWKKNNKEISKVFILKRNIVSVELDPFLETADVNVGNNHWPQKIVPSRFDIYKYNRTSRPNPMQ